MKKIIALLLAGLMIFTLVACNKDKTDAPADDPVADAAADDAAAPDETATPDDAEATDDTAVPDDSAASDETAEPDASEPNTGDVTEGLTVEDINARTGAKMVRPESMNILDEYGEIVEVNGAEVAQYFLLIDNVTCALRFSADLETDITEIPDDADREAFAALGDGEVYDYMGTKLCHWRTDDGQYVLLLNAEDDELFQSLYTQFTTPAA